MPSKAIIHLSIFADPEGNALAPLFQADPGDTGQQLASSYRGGKVSSVGWENTHSLLYSERHGVKKVKLLQWISAGERGYKGPKVPERRRFSGCDNLDVINF